MRRLRGLACALLCAIAPAGAGAGERLPLAGSLEVAFAPWDDPQAALIAAIGAARERILVQAYIFTSRPVARALVDASRRGVRVAVLADGKMHQRPAANVLAMLAEAGIEVALESAYAAAHNKVVVIDPDGASPAVLTGSYNLTWSASRKNAENLLIVRGHRALAQAYAANWARHRLDAVPIGGRSPGR